MRNVYAVAAVLFGSAVWGADVTLRDAVDAAVRHYPAIDVSEQQARAAAAQIQLARTAYLPRIDALAQFNRATHNNVSGLLFPQSVIPPISGPVLGTNNLRNVWGSAVGALVSWEPFDFGRRAAGVAAAQAARSGAMAAADRTRLDVAFAAADAFLTMVAAEETVRAAEAALRRSEALVQSTNALVGAQLRPGADASRAEAELTAARTQMIQAQQAVEVARAALAQYTGIEPATITTRAGRMVTALPQPPPPGPALEHNPLAREQSAAVNQAEAQLRELDRTYYPRLALQAAAYSRGTGAEVGGRNLGGLNGLAPDVQNYALGVTVTFPFFDFASVHARQAGQAATLRAEQARYRQVTVELRARVAAAEAAFVGAQRVAANTPVQVNAADTVLRQATARYEAGLSGIVDVAEAQRLLTQAEIDDVLARLGVWRSLLALEAARGSIDAFVAEASR